MGLHLYERIEKISAKVRVRKVPFPHGCDGYYASCLKTPFLEQLFERYQQIQEWLTAQGFTFSAFLPFVSHEVNLEKDMQRLAVVIRKHNVRGGNFTIQINAPGLFHKER